MLKPPSPENPTNPNRPVIMSAGEFRDFGDNSKKIVGVAAGEAHTLTLTWTFGRLGTGKESNELYPVPVKLDSSKEVGVSADRSRISWATGIEEDRKESPWTVGGFVLLIVGGGRRGFLGFQLQIERGGSCCADRRSSEYQRRRSGRGPTLGLSSI
ncbi:hypothetical protein AAC387_Pa04g1496 [Persea americana]